MILQVEFVIDVGALTPMQVRDLVDAMVQSVPAPSVVKSQCVEVLEWRAGK